MSDSTSLSVFADQGLSDTESAVCMYVLGGMTAKKAREKVGMSEHAYHKARADKPAFEQALTRARAILYEDRVDMLYEIATNTEDVNRAKAIIDAIKWAAGKYNPRFNEKLDINVTTPINAGDRWRQAALDRVLRLQCDSVPPIDGEFEQLPSVEGYGSVDNESVAPGAAPAVPDIFS